MNHITALVGEKQSKVNFDFLRGGETGWQNAKRH